MRYLIFVCMVLVLVSGCDINEAALDACEKSCDGKVADMEIFQTGVVKCTCMKTPYRPFLVKYKEDE